MPEKVNFTANKIESEHVAETRNRDRDRRNNTWQAARQSYHARRNGHQATGDHGITVISTMVPSRIFSGAIVDITGLDGISTIHLEY